MIVNSKGLGATVPTSSIISTGVTTAGGLTAAAAGAGLLSSIGIAATAVPFIGPIVGGIALAIAALGIGNGCGQTCITASNYANSFTTDLAQLQSTWAADRDANGGCISSSDQQEYVADFNQLWSQLTTACTQVGGQGGSQCIADRQRGGKYDAFSSILDPITATPVCGSVNDPNSSSIASSASGSSIDSSSLLLFAGIGIALLAFID